MYFTKLRKTLSQLEIMISLLTTEYACKSDKEIASLMANYFEVSVEDATEAIAQYRALSIKQDIHLNLSSYAGV
jgi:hypothetical protein